MKMKNTSYDDFLRAVAGMRAYSFTENELYRRFLSC